MDLNLPYIGCAVCHVSAHSGALYLTSCAHLLCHEHAARNASNPHSLESAKATCPACGHTLVSLVKVDNRLSDDIRPFFTPFPTQVEQLFAAAQFQYCGLVERIQFQTDTIDKLVEKVNKQKGLLVMAKDKINQIKDMESTIKRLDAENKRLRLESTNSAYRNSHGSNRQLHHQPQEPQQQMYPPPTVDLTEDSFGEELLPQQPQARRAVTKSFVEQVKQSSSQKVASLNQYKYTPRQHPDEQVTMDLTKGRLAESTNILRDSLTPAAPRHPIQTPSSFSSNRPTTLSSNGSASSGSFTSRSGDFMLPTATKSSSHQPPNPQGNRVSKSRAATSQLAQRLSAHMKIGSMPNSRRIQSSTGAQRPGTSFTSAAPLFRKRP